MKAAAVLAAVLALAGTAPVDRFPKAAASYVVQIDGRVAWARDADAPRPPASLAKIMTALVVLEHGFEPEAAVVVSRNAAATGGARLGLRAGERMRAGDLLTAMLVRSCNDAAVALAEHTSGSVPAFVVAMNARAASLGLTATRFSNPTGLDAPGLKSSAADLLVLAERALSFPEFATRVALERAAVGTLAGRRFDLVSSNALLGRFNGARGVKTGFTLQAGKCVVALAERDGHRVLAVLLDATDRWWSAAALLEAGLREAGAPAPS